MLGNPKWFKRRRYTGWGLTPVTWQGWAYVGVLIIFVLLCSTLIASLDLPKVYQIGVMLLLLAAIICETVDIWVRIDSDERESAHEAFSERNAAWTMVVILTGGIVYQAVSGALQGQLIIDPFLVAALFGGVITKAISNWYYLDK